MAEISQGQSAYTPSAATEIVRKDYSDSIAGSGIPAGAVVQFGGTSIPSGWLVCDGSLVSRSTYAALFAAISTLHGVGDGSSTFGLPDLRRRVPLGKSSSDTVGDNDGVAAGSRSLTHGHSVPAHHHALGTGADLNITASGSSTSGASGTSVSIQNSNIDHTHALAGSGATTSTDSGHNHSFSDPGHAHTQVTSANQGGPSVRFTFGGDGSGFQQYDKNSYTYNPFTGISINSNGAHTHTMVGNSAGMNSNTTHSHTVTDPGHTHSVPNHTHATGNFAGRIGLVAGGVDGNAAMSSGNNSAINYVIVHYLIKT